ncbi:hypothetical protein FKM82_024545 [Ascaphus truei]
MTRLLGKHGPMCKTSSENGGLFIMQRNKTRLLKRKRNALSCDALRWRRLGCLTPYLQVACTELNEILHRTAGTLLLESSCVGVRSLFDSTLIFTFFFISKC